MDADDARVPQLRRGSNSFYLTMGLAAWGIVLAGFGPGLIASPTPRYGRPTMLVWIHVVASVLWLLLYTAQCLLIRWGNRGVHQRLGWAGLPLAIAVVVLGLIMTIEQGRRGFAMWWNPDLEVDGLGELVHPLGDLLSFSILVTAGFLWRRRIEAHKRLMLLATTGSMMAAPLAHLISYFPALQDVPPIILFPLAALYFSSAVHDWRTRGRIHPVSLWGGVLLFAFAFTRAALIGPSTAWHSFVGWLVK